MGFQLAGTRKETNYRRNTTSADDTFRPSRSVPAPGQLASTLDNGRVLHLAAAALPIGCPCGGSCARCRTKPKVSQPGDASELEADRGAAHVMRMTDSALPSRDAGPESSQAHPDSRYSGGAGQPLPVSARSYFEPRFERDLSRVRVHTDEPAAHAARALHARAFSVGHDIVFGRDAYRPETISGKTLLAHELVHVVQHATDRAATGSIQRQENDDATTPQPTPDRAPYRLEFNNPFVSPGGHASLYELGPAILGFGLEKLNERYPGLNRSFWYRLGEWVLLGVAPEVPYMVFSHELGHYSIGKQFGWSPAPRLTGPFSGVTSAGRPPGGGTSAQNIAFAAGGVNQEEINARTIYSRWALRRDIRYQEALAYLLAQTNLALYTARTLSLKSPPAKDDINNYVTNTRSLSTRQLLMVAALADLLSGPTWAAAIGQIEYLRTGRRRVQIPEFSLGGQRLTFPDFQMQLLSSGPLLGGRMFLNAGGRIPVEFSFDTQLTSPGVAVGATFHALPVLTPKLRVSPFLRVTIDDPAGIALGAEVNYQIAPWVGISGTLGVRKNDLLTEPALGAGEIAGGGALTLSF